jgi:LmbE family N-acetylglucosaminyl deacetylase
MSSRRRRFAETLSVHLLVRMTIEIDSHDLNRRAIVFSPHPDDECLACAGTILRKKKAGASVKVVQMTDGQAATHANLITRSELRDRRRAEALNAGRVLGLDESDTYFLNYEDGRLSDYFAAAAETAAQILEREQPDEVFIPYAREPINLAADHVATTRIVNTALSFIGRSMIVWEYPVWFWMHWPWVPMRQGRPPIINTRSVVENSVQALFGARAFADLRYSVDISDVIDLKRAALAQHRSQMERIVPDPRWLTLSQIASGEFLARFDYQREFFRRWEFGLN